MHGYDDYESKANENSLLTAHNPSSGLMWYVHSRAAAALLTCVCPAHVAGPGQG